jgi:uncharacterized protein YjlB
VTADDLAARLVAESLVAEAWSNQPGDQYRTHAHDYDKVIVVAVGSIAFGLPGSGERLELERGDRLELPAGIAHDASVGPIGVTCLEAHLPAGGLPAGPRRRRAGDW